MSFYTPVPTELHPQFYHQFVAFDTSDKKILVTFHYHVSSGPIMAFVQEHMQRGCQINQRPDFHHPIYSVVMTVPWHDVDIIQRMAIVESVRYVL